MAHKYELNKTRTTENSISNSRQKSLYHVGTFLPIYIYVYIYTYIYNFDILYIYITMCKYILYILLYILYIIYILYMLYSLSLGNYK